MKRTLVIAQNARTPSTKAVPGDRGFYKHVCLLIAVLYVWDRCRDRFNLAASVKRLTKRHDSFGLLTLARIQVEHVWDVTERHLYVQPPPSSEDELLQIVSKKRKAIPQDAICTLFDFLPRCVSSCILICVGPTTY
ncbi:hypothetical protein TNCV_3928131 [Trichonephila clavipes]|nr:hypothetical protein TNCV_3928131 [Trichonephila clavipes]